MFHKLNFKFIFQGKEGQFKKCLISEKKLVKFQVLTILLVTDMQSPSAFLFSNFNKRPVHKTALKQGYTLTDLLSDGKRIR